MFDEAYKAVNLVEDCKRHDSITQIIMLDCPNTI
jgi:hypothetical protein